MAYWINQRIPKQHRWTIGEITSKGRGWIVRWKRSRDFKGKAYTCVLVNKNGTPHNMSWKINKSTNGIGKWASATTIVVVENTSLVIHQEKVLVEPKPLHPYMLHLGDEQPLMNDHEYIVFEKSEQGIMVTGKGCNRKETFMEHEKIEP